MQFQLTQQVMDSARLPSFDARHQTLRRHVLNHTPRLVRSPSTLPISFLYLPLNFACTEFPTAFCHFCPPCLLFGNRSVQKTAALRLYSSSLLAKITV